MGLEGPTWMRFFGVLKVKSEPAAAKEARSVVKTREAIIFADVVLLCGLEDWEEWRVR